MNEPFLNLGSQPLANNFLSRLDEKEYFYTLEIGFDKETNLVSLINIPDSSLAFNENYAYVSSTSETMKNHFADCAKQIEKLFKPSSVLEIGSNDGIFIKNFNTNVAECVEPCKNFAQITTNIGYITYNNMFNENLPSNKQYDIIYAANSIPHIPNLDEVFKGIVKFLKDNGMFIMECPSLLSIINNYSYDQWYNEHPHTFSLLSLSKILKKYGLYIWKCEELPVHGGSYRVYINKIKSGNIDKIILKEKIAKLDDFTTYIDFAKNIHIIKEKTIELVNKFDKVVAYGATAKSTTVLNYCQIKPECIIDSTPSKQNKYSPGMHIPIVPRIDGLYEADAILLTAWNYFDEIIKKEYDYLNKGGKFIVLPNPYIYGK